MAEMFSRLKKTAVTAVTVVTPVTSYDRKPLKLRPLRPLRPENSKGENDAFGVVTEAVTEQREAEILERASLCAGSVPAIYADCLARLQSVHPAGVSTYQWQQALDDAAYFLEKWGAEAEADGWTAGELFDVPKSGKAGGLLWRLDGAVVEAFGPDHARLGDGRVIERESIGGEQ